MPASRNRLWLVALVVSGNLFFGLLLSGIARKARADSVPIIVLPSAQGVRQALAVAPVIPEVPTLRQLSMQSPELLPLPQPATGKWPEIRAPRPAHPAQPLERAPIPIELPKPRAVAQPPLPAVIVPQIPQTDLRLQPAEPRNNVKSSDPLPPLTYQAVPVPDPKVFAPKTLPPGESLMPLSLRRSALSALLGTGLVAGTIYADAEPPKKDDAAVSKKDAETTHALLGDLKKQLTELKTKDFADLQSKIAELKTKELTAIKADLDQMKAFKKQVLEALEGTDKGDGLLKKLAAIDEKLNALAKQVENLDKKVESSRTALASPLAKEAPKTGTVKLVNMYATDVDILVNGKGYRLAPNESKTLVLEPGTFTYQLLTGGGEEKKRTIKESEEVLLKVN